MITQYDDYSHDSHNHNNNQRNVCYVYYMLALSSCHGCYITTIVVITVLINDTYVLSLFLLSRIANHHITMLLYVTMCFSFLMLL